MLQDIRRRKVQDKTEDTDDIEGWGDFLRKNSFVYLTYNFLIRSSVFPQWLLHLYTK